MKRVKRFLKIAGVVVVAVVVTAAGIITFSGPPLPEGAEETIDAVVASDLPELLRGETGYVHNGDVRVWYESRSPAGPSQGAVLLFMGISNDALAWPQGFLDALVDAGYRVIRYDYRGTGLSDWVEDWREEPYALSDLAADGIAILDALGVERAHLLGVSMGGMVAQEFAIHHPQRALTLTTIMSSGHITDPDLPPISRTLTLKLILAALKYGIIRTERNTVRLHVATRVLLRGDAEYAIDVRETAESVLYNLRQRNGYNAAASAQHQAAVTRSGSRYRQLAQLDLPTLVMHGVNDPFVPIEHSEKLAAAIPNAQTRWFKNMGHDIPAALYEPIIAELIRNFERNP